MNITDLEQYPRLLNEIKILDERIKKYSKQGNEIVADTVKDYSTGYGRNIIIRGRYARMSAKAKKAQIIRSRRKKCLEEKTVEIETFIDSIDDSVIRQIITLYCLEGKTWEDVGRELAMDRRTASRKFYMFFEKLPTMPINHVL